MRNKSVKKPLQHNANVAQLDWCAGALLGRLSALITISDSLFVMLSSIVDLVSVLFFQLVCDLRGYDVAAIVWCRAESSVHY
jgi:hypothetical protein